MHATELDMEEVINFWFNSHEDFDPAVISSYAVNEENTNAGYFTQLAWAKSHKMGIS